MKDKHKKIFKKIKSGKYLKTCKFEENKFPQKNLKGSFGAPYSRNFKNKFKKLKVGNTLKHANLKKKNFKQKF
jgi:hypothetical protein